MESNERGRGWEAPPIARATVIAAFGIATVGGAIVAMQSGAHGAAAWSAPAVAELVLELVACALLACVGSYELTRTARREPVLYLLAGVLVALIGIPDGVPVDGRWAATAALAAGAGGGLLAPRALPESLTAVKVAMWAATLPLIVEGLVRGRDALWVDAPVRERAVAPLVLFATAASMTFVEFAGIAFRLRAQQRLRAVASVGAVLLALLAVATCVAVALLLLPRGCGDCSDPDVRAALVFFLGVGAVGAVVLRLLDDEPGRSFARIVWGMRALLGWTVASTTLVLLIDGFWHLVGFVLGA